MSVIAHLKGVRSTPRKVGVVAALVRGRTVADAIVILENTPRRSAKAVKEAVKSAGANASHNHNYKPDSLFISEISVSPGVRLKRWTTSARGGSRKFQRPTSHIRVVVDGQQREAKKKPVEKSDKSDKETK